MDDESLKISRKSVIEQNLQGNHTGFITTNNVDLELAKEKWNMDGLKVIEVILDNNSQSKQVILEIGSKALGQEITEPSDFYDALEDKGLGEKLAFTINIDSNITDQSQILQLADEFRSMRQHNGVRYIVSAKTLEEIPVEFKVATKSMD